MTRVGLGLLLLSVFCVHSALAETSADNLIEEVKNLRPFELKKSALACPVILVGQSCPEETPFYYFKCCGDLASNCCFRLQEWVVVLLVVLAVLVVISIVVNFIRCLCCY